MSQTNDNSDASKDAQTILTADEYADDWHNLREQSASTVSFTISDDVSQDVIEAAQDLDLIEWSLGSLFGDDTVKYQLVN